MKMNLLDAYVYHNVRMVDMAFLDEHLNMIQWMGCILNILGVLMITLSKKKLSTH